ncbi:unnamed protein product [Gordionus sp. m RMFG-2023]|uniref:transportin-3-like n=1 Tax=Gordionus sp. m RMFG-2023 TaxID=3053472 RepID=UPI0030E00A79
MELDIQNILNAINTLYHGKQDKEKASQYLSNLQHSSNGWDIATKLLLLKHSFEASYFAAQTLKQKIQNNFNELPLELYKPLQDSLYQYIYEYHNQNNIVINQLSLAIADFILRAPNIDESLSTLFLKLNDNKWDKVLLEILTDLVEELQSRSLKLGSNKKTVITQKLSAYSKAVLNKLDEITIRICLQPQTDSELFTKVFKCLERWIEAHMIDIDINLTQSKAFMACLDKLSLESLNDTDIKVHEKAADVLVATIIAIEEPSMYPEVSQYIIIRILPLSSAYFQCFQHDDDINGDKAINYCSLFTELGNLCLTSIISNPKEGFGILEIVDLLLNCVTHSDNEVSEITFNFWYNFAECLYNNTSVTKDEAKLALFKPYVNKLLQNLFNKITLDSDYDGIPDHHDDIGEYRIRIYELIQDLAFASDPISIINQMVTYIREQLSPLQNFNHAFTNHIASVNNWPTLEAAFFLISALMKELLSKLKKKNHIPNNIDTISSESDLSIISMSTSIQNLLKQICDILKDDILPKLYALIYPPAFVNTCVELISDMSEWLAYSPDYLDSSLNFLFAILIVSPTKDALKLSCLRAVTNICGHASKNTGSQSLLITKYLPNLLILSESQNGTLDATSSSNLVLKNSIDDEAAKLRNVSLNHACRQELIKAICIILPYLKDQTSITQCLSVICEKLIQGLLHEINSKSMDSDCDPSPWLDQISSLFKPFTIYKSSTIPSILTPMIGKIWPVLNQLFLAFQNCEHKTEKICRTIKHIFRAVGREGSSFILPQLVGTILNLYQTKHHSSYLYLGSVIVEEFYPDTNYKSGLIQMFENFTLHTITYICDKVFMTDVSNTHNSPSQKILQLPQEYMEYWNKLEQPETILSALKQIPDNIEDYFRLCQKFVKYLTLPFLKNQYFPHVFKIFISSCYLDHREAHSASMLFLCDFISVCSSDSQDNSDNQHEKKRFLDTLLNEKGQTIIDSLIKAIVFNLSSQLYPEVADVIYELMVYNKRNVTYWIDSTLHDIQQQRQNLLNSSQLSASLSPESSLLSEQCLNEFRLSILNATQEKHITRAFRELAQIFK